MAAMEQAPGTRGLNWVLRQNEAALGEIGMPTQAHILHVFATFAPGGPQILFANIASALGDRFRHTVMAMDNDFSALTLLDPRLNVKSLPPPPRQPGPFYHMALAKAITRCGPDVINTYNWGAMDAVIGARLAGICAVIHAEHGFGQDEAMRLKSRRVLARRLILNRIYKTVLCSKRLIAIARDQYKLRPDKVEYIANGVDTDVFRPVGHRGCRPQFGVPDDAIVFGYLGHLRPEKNLGLLIRGFARANLDRAKLVVVGPGECRGELETLANGLGLGDRIVFTGYTKDRLDCYAAFDVYAMSSTTEQAPLSLLEAMAVGLPAIATDVGDVSELLGTREQPVIVPSNDVDAYANSLRQLRDRTLRNRLGMANRARCVERYSLERVVEAYEALYRQAIASNRKAA